MQLVERHRSFYVVADPLALTRQEDKHRLGRFCVRPARRGWANSTFVNLNIDNIDVFRISVLNLPASELRTHAFDSTTSSLNPISKARDFVPRDVGF